MFPEYQDDAYNFDSRTNFKEELWGFQPAVAPHSLSRIVFPPKLPRTRVPQSEDVLFFNNNKINRVGGILCTTNKQLQQTPSNGRCSCPMNVAVTSVRRLDRLHRFADPGQACPCRLSICLLLGCAGHSWPSDPSRPARTGHANKCSASRIRRRGRQHRAKHQRLVAR